MEEARGHWREARDHAGADSGGVGDTGSARPLRFDPLVGLQGGEAPRRADAIDPRAAERYRRYFHAMLEQGVYLAPSSYEVGFLSLAHEEEHLERLCAGIAAVLAEMSPS